MRWKKPCSLVVLQNIINFFFKRFSNNSSTLEKIQSISPVPQEGCSKICYLLCFGFMNIDLSAVLLKRLSFFSQSLSPPYFVFFW